MNEAEMETEGCEWTTENLQMLLTSMKASIPKNQIRRSYTKGLQTLDWNKVAFPPFSPEACQQKWTEILQKICKVRTLTELIVDAEDVISNPFLYAKIHPEVPKRPSPANAIYYEENKARICKKHPELSTQKLLKLASKKYQKLPDKEKAQYVEKFNLAAEEYQRKMHQFRKNYGNGSCPVSKPAKKRKGIVAEQSVKQGENTEGLPPKPPINGYNLFCKEQQRCMDSNSEAPLVSLWAQRWRDLSKTEKAKYSARCAELKRQYTIDLNEFLQRFDEEKQNQILSENGIKIPKKDKQVKKLPGEPKMPSGSGNAIFCKSHMELLKDKIPNARERFTKVNRRWQTLPTKEKEHYRTAAFERMQGYSVKLQKWFEKLTPAEKEDFLKHNPSKHKYICYKTLKVPDSAEPGLDQPSDSEDEVMEDDSSDEEQSYFDCNEEDGEEEEEDYGSIGFDMF